MSTVANVQSRIAGLAESDNDQIISGVAIGVGDVTRGLSGDQKVWTAAELREAAATLEGTPVNPLHSQSEVGEVVRAGFDPDRGVIYEAELEDPALAEQVANGQLEVSIEARHVDGGRVETDHGEAMLAEDIQFTGMALVQHGAAPSASASPGEAAALSPAAIHETLDRATLAEVNGTEIALTPPDRVINAIEAAMDAKAEYADAIGDCGTGVGEAMGEAILDGPTPELLLNGADVAQNSPAGYLDSHSEDVAGIDDPPTEWGEETWTDGCGPVQHALWGHYLDWFDDKQQQIEDAMEDSDMAKHQDEDADMAEVPEEFVFDNPGEAVSKAEEMGFDGAGDEMIHSHGEGEDTAFMPAPSHDELMDTLREMDALAASARFEVGDLVEWETSQGSNGTGRVAAVVTEPGETVSAEGAAVTREATEDEAAYKLDNWVGPEAGFEEGVVVKSASEMVGAWEDAPDKAAEMAATDTDDPVSPERGQGEVSAGGEPDGRTGDRTDAFNAHMSETEEELRARLSEKDDEIADLQNRVEQLESERADVARAYAEALAAGDTVFDEDDLVENFSVAELREKYDDTDTATLAEAEPTVQSGSGDDSPETASLSESEQADVAEHREVIAELAGSDTVIATKERERRADLVADITGEDPETILDQEA